MPKKQRQTKVEKDLEELTGDLKRVQADFVNYQRRTEEEKAQIMEIAKETIIAELLPVLDDINRALAHVPKELANNTWAQGVAQIAKQTESALHTFGVEPIRAKGEEFNPQVHEAVSFDEGDGEHEIVLEEMRTGYKLGDKVIRPSMVKVGKRQSASKSTGEGRSK